MKPRRFLLISALAAGWLAASCSTTRVLGDGQYQLVRNEVKVLNDKKFDTGLLEPYIKQKPKMSPSMYVYN